MEDDVGQRVGPSPVAVSKSAGQSCGLLSSLASYSAAKIRKKAWGT